MDVLNRQPRMSGTRMDVHRHSLADKRMDYAWMNANLPRERGSRVVTALRGLRTVITAMFLRAQQSEQLKRTDEPADITVIV